MERYFIRHSAGEIRGDDNKETFQRTLKLLAEQGYYEDNSLDYYLSDLQDKLKKYISEKAVKNKNRLFEQSGHEDRLLLVKYIFNKISVLLRSDESADKVPLYTINETNLPDFTVFPKKDGSIYKILNKFIEEDYVKESLKIKYVADFFKIIKPQEPVLAPKPGQAEYEHPQQTDEYNDLTGEVAPNIPGQETRAFEVTGKKAYDFPETATHPPRPGQK